MNSSSRLRPILTVALFSSLVWSLSFFGPQLIVPAIFDGRFITDSVLLYYILREALTFAAFGTISGLIYGTLLYGFGFAVHAAYRSFWKRALAGGACAVPCAPMLCLYVWRGTFGHMSITELWLLAVVALFLGCLNAALFALIRSRSRDMVATGRRR